MQKMKEMNQKVVPDFPLVVPVRIWFKSKARGPGLRYEPNWASPENPIVQAEACVATCDKRGTVRNCERYCERDMARRGCR